MTTVADRPDRAVAARTELGTLAELAASGDPDRGLLDRRLVAVLSELTATGPPALLALARDASRPLSRRAAALAEIYRQTAPRPGAGTSNGGDPR